MNILDEKVYDAIVTGDMETEDWIKEIFFQFILENFADLKDSHLEPRCQYPDPVNEEFKRHMTAGMHHDLFKLRFYGEGTRPHVQLTEKAKNMVESFVNL